MVLCSSWAPNAAGQQWQCASVRLSSVCVQSETGSGSAQRRYRDERRSRESSRRVRIYRFTPYRRYVNAAKRPTLAMARRVVIPGNHDRFHGHAPYLPNDPAFDGTFRRHWRRSSRVNTLAVLRHRADSTVLAVIGADFSLRRRRDATTPLVGYLGQGKVYDQTLKALQAETKRVQGKYDAVAILWAVHFAAQFPKLGRALKLIDGSKLLSAAKAMKVQYILCGHTHEASDYPPLSGVHVLCAGTAMEFGARIQCIHMREFSVIPGSGAISHSQTQYNWDATVRQYI